MSYFTSFIRIHEGCIFSEKSNYKRFSIVLSVRLLPHEIIPPIIPPPVQRIHTINYDITALLTIDSALGSLLHTEPETDTYTVSKPHSPQTITRNVEELLNDLMQQGVALVGKPVALMTKEDKIQVVRYLNDAGAFLITKSGDKVANLLNISKFTLYSYMDAGK